MRRLAPKRLQALEDRHRVAASTEQLLFLIPDLWPEEDQHRFETAGIPELQDLIARRAGIRSSLTLKPFWTFTVPASDEMLAMSEAEKAAFLERYESRPVRPGR